jgi:trans-aconitate 2-methyltransferase
MTRWNAGDYHEHSAQQTLWATDLLRRLDLKGDERILDIGCGDGKVTAEIARGLPRGTVVGIDSSAEMIAFARETFGSAANLQFQQGDARVLNFDAAFDRVVSFSCLHWIADHRPVLSGIVRSLRPGGRILLQFGGKGNAADMVKVVSDVMAHAAWKGFFAGFAFPWNFPAPEEYRPLLDEAGLRTVRLELAAKDMTQDGRAGLAGWLRTTWMPYIQRIPEDSRPAFLNEVLDEYLAFRPPHADGTVHLAMMRLEVEAFKKA